MKASRRGGGYRPLSGDRRRGCRNAGWVRLVCAWLCGHSRDSRHSTFSCQAERNVLHLFSRCADQRETRLPGSDEAVQPSDAVGDVPSRVRRLVRWKKVRWRKLIADHLSLAVPIGEIAASARLMANALVRKWRHKGPKRFIARPEMVWPRTPGTYKIGCPHVARRSIRPAPRRAPSGESCDMPANGAAKT
jgi:hypothetical protein